MGFDLDNFQASSNIAEYSEGDLKALLKRRYGLTAKKAKEVYNKIHGIDNTVSKKANTST